MPLTTNGPRPMEWDMDSSLEPGTAIAVAPDGIRSVPIHIPDEMPPPWATKLVLSVEDFGRLLRYMSEVV
jgi:hypothetical protein